MSDPIEIRFHVPAVPVAQPRQRHAIIAGHVHNYTPTKHPVNSFKAAVQVAAQAAYSGPPLQTALALTVTFLLPRPGRLIWKNRRMGRLPHIGRPDTENLIKSLLDACTGILWRDDAQVFRLDAEKLYAGGDEQPGVHVLIETFRPTPTPKEPNHAEHDKTPLFAE